MSVKTKIIQKYIDEHVLDELQKEIAIRLITSKDMGLKIDLDIALNLLKECFKCGFVERVVK